MLTGTFILIGLCLGSFINVVLSRRDWYKGRSHCDSCGYTLRWYDLIPVVSYCLLRGECRKCHSKIGIIHLASEIYMGCGFGIASLYFHESMVGITILAAVIFLAVYAISDTQIKEISVLYLYGGIFSVALTKAIAIALSGETGGLIHFFITSVIAFLVCYICAKAADGYVGAGDFDIILLIYLTVGGFDTLKCIVVTSVLGTCLYLPLVLSGRHDRNAPLPLAPLFYVAFIINLTMLGGGFI